MNTTLTRSFFDACFYAKQLLNHLPPLPQWLTPRQLKVIDAVYQLQKTHESIRISDIAHHLEGTMPSITRMVTDLEAHDVLLKAPCPTDKRAQTLSLTPFGEKLYTQYIDAFQTHMSVLFEEINEDDMLTAIDVITQARSIMMRDNFSFE